MTYLCTTFNFPSAEQRKPPPRVVTIACQLGTEYTARDAVYEMSFESNNFGMRLAAIRANVVSHLLEHTRAQLATPHDSDTRAHARVRAII